VTVASLERNQVDVAVLFTTDPSITAKGFVLLQDDKHLRLADWRWRTAALYAEVRRRTPGLRRARTALVSYSMDD
jgi:glycine betaine/choline ABC-type transport system substrate-binding protein